MRLVWATVVCCYFCCFVCLLHVLQLFTKLAPLSPSLLTPVHLAFCFLIQVVLQCSRFHSIRSSAGRPLHYRYINLQSFTLLLMHTQWASNM